MNKIVKVADDIDQKALAKAEECHREVLARTYIVAGHMVELGKLFKTIRDEKLYKLLGADTFDEYCGFTEVSFGRSTIYSFIKIYELYVLKLGYDQVKLSKIGHRKLQIISKTVGIIVSLTPDYPVFTDDWLEKAELLSESDLINEVRRAQNKPEMIPKPKEVENVYPFNFDSYLDFVKSHPCIVCPEEESDPAHFPRSKGAGGQDTHRIPLCRKCHTEFHKDPFDFLWLYKDKVFEYFYKNILEAYSIIRRDKNEAL